jgi:hypothetical protein
MALTPVRTVARTKSAGVSLVHRGHATAAMTAVARPSSRGEKAQRRRPTAAADPAAGTRTAAPRHLWWPAPRLAGRRPPRPELERSSPSRCPRVRHRGAASGGRPGRRLRRRRLPCSSARCQRRSVCGLTAKHNTARAEAAGSPRQATHGQRPCTAAAFLHAARSPLGGAEPVGFENSVMRVSGGHAAALYSLIRPPRTSRLWMWIAGARTSMAGGWSGG